MGKKITIYLKEDIPKGVREAEIDGWLGKAVCGPRIKLNDIRALEELREGASVYFLLGYDTDSSLPMVYVGEADPFAPRGKQHDVGKDWWEHVIIFVYKDRSLTKTGAEYLEHKTIESLRTAGRCLLQNGTNPTMPTVAEYDRSALDQFLDNIKLILPLLGYDIFPMEQTNINSGTAGHDLLQLHLQAAGNVEAKAVMQNDGKVRVIKGSRARKEEVPSFSTCAYKGLRDELIQMERLVLKEGIYEFSEDYEFDSLSAAAAVTMGRSAAGPREWKVDGGKTVQDYLESEIK